ncbi:MAG: hypothetical protein LBR48_01255 [Dysgonamonadaceae bacterium]|jgi:lantibiotic modifying enzyme|nr:hypothetical protein [Dysgonamonadaceae bacterium]
MTSNSILPRLARYLMLYASGSDSPGLLDGKMGITLFFYHYSRTTDDKLYARFADCLLDEVLDEISRETPLWFSNGLCGIGWGIEYLLRSGFVKADPDRVFEDLDRRIAEWDVRRITDCSLETGLAGVAAYVIGRRQNRRTENPFFSDDYCNDLIKTLYFNEIKGTDGTLLSEILSKTITDNDSISDFYNPVSHLVAGIKWTEKKLFSEFRHIGIENNGFTGAGLKLANF